MKIRVVNIDKESPQYHTSYFIENVEEIIIAPTDDETFLLYRIKGKEYGVDYDEVEATKHKVAVAIQED